MPLGSAPTTKIDIDFTRAQGVASEGRIGFQPPRQKVGTTMLDGTIVLVPLVAGVATVDLVRLPQGTYRVVEQLKGRPDRAYDFALPLSAPAVVQYEDIVQVNPVPAKHQYVSTINDVAPDVTTGNIVLATGGASSLDELADVLIASPLNNQVVRFDNGLWKNLSLAAVALSGAYSSLSGLPAIPDDPADIGAAALVHTHTVAQLTDFVESVDARIQQVVDSAPSALDTLNELAQALNDDPNFAATVTTALAAKAALVHTHAISQITDLQAALDTIPLRALPDRILRIADHSKQAGAANTYNMQNTDNAWAFFTDGPPEYSVQAAVGDDVEVSYSYLINGATTSYVDLAVVTGPTPTRQRYLASGIATPTFQGAAGDYPDGAAFQGRQGTLGFTVEAGDLDSGNVRLRWVIKTANTNGKMYANDNYPLLLGIRVTRRSGV